MSLRLLNECVAGLGKRWWRTPIWWTLAGMIFETGFAPFRGGPMHYLRKQGKVACLTVEALAE